MRNPGIRETKRSESAWNEKGSSRATRPESSDGPSARLDAKGTSQDKQLAEDRLNHDKSRLGFINKVVVTEQNGFRQQTGLTPKTTHREMLWITAGQKIGITLVEDEGITLAEDEGITLPEEE